MNAFVSVKSMWLEMYPFSNGLELFGVEVGIKLFMARVMRLSDSFFAVG